MTTKPDWQVMREITEDLKKIERYDWFSLIAGIAQREADLVRKEENERWAR